MFIARLLRYQKGSLRQQASFLTLMLVGMAGVLPFAVLLSYAHPALDDFSYAQHYLVVGFGLAQRQLYFGLTGRYVSSAMLGVANPLSYGWPTGQGVGGAALLLLWWCALLLLGRELLWPMLSWSKAVMGSLLVLALSLAQLPSPAEGLYWLAGGYTYLVPSALTLLLLAVLLRRHRAPTRRRWTLLAALLILAIMGGNEINGLVLLSGLLIMAVVGDPAGRLWALVAVATAGAAVAWGAPGNFVRMHHIGYHPTILGVVGRSLGAAAYCLLNWIGTGVLPLAALLLAGWLHQQATVRPLPLSILTRRPLLLTLLLLGLLTLSFVPSYWATGLTMPRRARNAVHALFVVGWLLVVYSWAQRYWQYYPAPKRWSPLLVASGWVWLGLALLTDHNVSLRHDQMGASPTSLVQAYRDWFSGSAAAYDQEQRARYAQLRTRTPTAEPFRLDPLQHTPPTLFYYDISVNSRLWGNASYAQYFGWPALYVDSQH